LAKIGFRDKKHDFRGNPIGSPQISPRRGKWPQKSVLASKTRFLLFAVIIRKQLIFADFCSLPIFAIFE
jgi:hypothetical protein